MEVKMLSTVALAVMMLYMSTVFVNFVRAAPNPDETAGDIVLLHEVLRVADKYLGEDLSYAYYLELNSVFDPTDYSDQGSETWNVPSWFSNPPGGSEAKCDGLGCTVWNLSGGTGQTDPCPDVVPYSPTPSLDSVLAKVTASNISSRLSALVSQSNSKIYNALSTTGRSFDVRYSGIQVKKDGNLFTASADIGATVSRSFYSFSKSRPVSKTIESEHSLNLTISTKNATGYCICDIVGGSTNVTVATYRITRYYLLLDVENNKIPTTWAWRKEVDDSILIIQHFSQRITNNPGGNTFTNCRIIIP